MEVEEVICPDGFRYKLQKGITLSPWQLFLIRDLQKQRARKKAFIILCIAKQQPWYHDVLTLIARFVLS